MRLIRVVTLCAILPCVAVSGLACSSDPDRKTETGATGRTPVVYAVNYPVYYFATRIAGDAADVRFAAPADIDPAFWQPEPHDIEAMQQADRILANGADYARWLSYVTLPQGRVVNTSAAFQDRYLETHEAVTHGHGPKGEHSHTGTGFTTWIDLSQAALQAEAVYEAFLEARISTPDALRKNFSDLRDELLELDGQIMDATKRVRGQPILTSHPVYHYFARRYLLDIRSVLWEPGAAPSGTMWRELETLQKDHPAEWMIWEGDPLAGSVERLQVLGVRSVVFDPCSNRPEKGDFMSVMRRNVSHLQGAFNPTP